MFNGTLSSDPATAAAEILEIVEHMTVTRYLLLAGFFLLIYDHFLTLAEEIEFVWRRPKNLISWIFLANRYLVPVILSVDLYDKMGAAKDLTVIFCQVWVNAEIVLHVVSHASIHALVVIRVNALWGNRSMIRWSLYSGWVIYFIITMAIALATGIEHVESFRPVAIINMCFSVVGNYVFWVWVPPLVLEFALFALTVVKATKQSHRTITSMPLAYVLYRDGVLYFIVIVLCSFFNLIVWRWLPISYFALAKYFTLAMVNVMSSRMVLNLRQLGGVQSDGTPPSQYYAEPMPSQVYKDGELTFDGDASGPREIRFHRRDFNRITSPSRKDQSLPPAIELNTTHFSHKSKDRNPQNDPYFYNRQASQLRALKVRRPDFSFTVTPTVSDHGVAPNFSYMGTAEIEETVAMGAITPTSAGAHSKRSSITSSKLAPPLGEGYNMETWSVNTIPLSQAQTRDVEVRSTTSSDSAGSRGASNPSKAPGWNV